MQKRNGGTRLENQRTLQECKGCGRMEAQRFRDFGKDGCAQGLGLKFLRPIFLKNAQEGHDKKMISCDCIHQNTHNRCQNRNSKNKKQSKLQIKKSQIQNIPNFTFVATVVRRHAHLSASRVPAPFGRAAALTTVTTIFEIPQPLPTGCSNLQVAQLYRGNWQGVIFMSLDLFPSLSVQSPEKYGYINSVSHQSNPASTCKGDIQILSNSQQVLEKPWTYNIPMVLGHRYVHLHRK